MTNSTAFEVGAHLFETSVYSQLNDRAIPLDFMGGNQQFSNAYENLLNRFDQNNFNTATRTFLQSSYNQGGDYNRLQPRIITNPVIKRFYPLLK